MTSRKRARLSATAIVVLAGLATTAPPAAPGRAVSDDQPLTKWLPGERKPNVSSPTLFRLGPTPTTPSLGVGPSSPTTGSARSMSGPAATVVAPTVTVRSRLQPDKRRFHLGEPIHLYVDLAWEGNAGDVTPEAPEQPTLINLAKKAMVQTSWVAPQGGGGHTAVVTYHYVLEPNAEGAASIEPIEIRYRLRGEGDVLKLTSDRYALTILPRRWPWKKIALGSLAAVGALCAGVAGGTVLASRARRKREAAKQAPPPLPLEAVGAEIDHIRRLFREGVAKDGHDAAERFVRKALELRLGGDLRHATISELAERLANETLESAVRDRAASILDRCAQVKFAGYVPTVADQDQVVADCRLLLDDLKKDEGGRMKAEG